jgi:FixJ family two-component response regulator
VAHADARPLQIHGRSVAGCEHEDFMTRKRLLVSVVDDDESVRESLPDLLREFGFEVRAFSSAEDFLASDCVDETKCLILDIGMPGMTGPELQQELKNRRQGIPIIFITAQRDEAICSRVLRQGATACLFKPFSDTALSDAVNAALE